jgi:hypothetical protein
MTIVMMCITGTKIAARSIAMLHESSHENKVMVV